MSESPTTAAQLKEFLYQFDKHEKGNRLDCEASPELSVKGKESTKLGGTWAEGYGRGSVRSQSKTQGRTAEGDGCNRH